MDEPRSDGERSRFPNPFLKSSKLNLKAVFGAVWVILEFRQVFANERLARTELTRDIGATRALGRRMSAFHRMS
jgi:hypothetical protein